LFHDNIAQTFSLAPTDGQLNYQSGEQRSKFDANQSISIDDSSFYVPVEVVTDDSKLQIAYKEVLKESFDSQEERLFGIYFHLLMGVIEAANELDKALDIFIVSGQIDVSMRGDIKAAAEMYFTVAEEKDLLVGVQKVLNEHAILVPTGKILRPDKVLVRNSDIIVLDFKTGASSKKHQEQVWNYKRNLEEIFGKKVIPMLYYTQSNELIQI